MRKFYYAATTDQNAKGVYFFSVSVVLDRTGFTVTEYGNLPMKLRMSRMIAPSAPHPSDRHFCLASNP